MIAPAPGHPDHEAAAPPADHRRHAVAVFFGLAFVITWAVWIPRALASYGVIDGDLAIEVGSVWTYGPAMAAVAAAALMGGRPALHDLGARLGRWRVGWRWWALVVGGPAALWSVVALLHAAMGGDIDAAQPRSLQAGLAALLPLLVILCLTDGLGEETGWRGYALPRLLTRLSPLAASLLLGVVWALWHLPLHWTAGAPLQGAAALLLFVELPLSAVIYTWIFRHTDGSALVAIVLHGTINLFAVALPSTGSDGDPRPYLIALAVRAVLVLVIVGAARHDWLRRPAQRLP